MFFLGLVVALSLARLEDLVSGLKYYQSIKKSFIKTSFKFLLIDWFFCRG